MSLIRTCLSSLVLVVALLVVTTSAKASGTTSQDIILSVTDVNDTVHSLNMQTLREIGVESITTSTIWTEGVHEFTGVPLVALLRHLDIQGGEIQAFAINDYSVSIPASDARPGGPILAFEQNGEPIPRRRKGPLWIIYPFDSAPEFRTETIYSRSIWQLNRLVISD